MCNYSTMPKTVFFHNSLDLDLEKDPQSYLGYVLELKQFLVEYRAY